jgi:hypothetical protein
MFFFADSLILSQPVNKWNNGQDAKFPIQNQAKNHLLSTKSTKGQEQILANIENFGYNDTMMNQNRNRQIQK